MKCHTGRKWDSNPSHSSAERRRGMLACVPRPPGPQPPGPMGGQSTGGETEPISCSLSEADRRGHRDQKKLSVTAKYQGQNDLQGQASERTEQQNRQSQDDMTMRLQGEGPGGDLGPVDSRVLGCCSRRGPAAAILRDPDPAASTTSPLYGPSLKKVSHPGYQKSFGQNILCDLEQVT